MSTLDEMLDNVVKKFEYRKETEFQGVKFGLALLTLAEEKKMNALPAQEMEGLEYYDEMRKTVLSHAIRSVDGHDIPEIVPVVEDEKESTKERAIYLRGVLDKVPSAVVEHLFDVYLDLKEEAEEKFNKTVKYQWFKTPEQRQEEAQQKLDEMAKQPEADAKTSEESSDKNAEESSDLGLKLIPDEPKEDEKKPE